MRLGQILPPPRRNASLNTPLILRKCGYHARRSFFGFPGVAPGLGKEGQTYHERKILPYTPKQLYDVVSDVDSYYHFVPYCLESKVLNTGTSTGKSGLEIEHKRARLAVGFLSFKESYVSDVTCVPYSSVEAVASSGTPLFKELSTTWRFQSAHPSSPHSTQADLNHVLSGDGNKTPTLLSIDLAFAFSNPLYAAASSAFFKQVSEMTIKAFEERCIQIYGSGKE